MKKLDITVVILSFNTLDVLKTCINSINKYENKVSKIIFVDNNSTDGSVEYLESLVNKNKNFELIKLKENKGFAAGNNVGIKRSKTKYTLLLNSDTEFKSSILKKMTKFLDDHSNVGAVSCKLVYPDGRVQGTGGYFPTILRVFSWMTIQDLPFTDKLIRPFHPLREKSINTSSDFYESKKELDWITGAFFLFRTKLVKDIGFIDERYFMYTEDVDFCYRIKKAGWKIMYLPKWKIIHYGGSSSTREFPIISEFKGIKKFYSKFYPKWQYPILKLLLKVGTFLRMIVFGVTEGRESFEIYKKAFLSI